MDEVVDVDDAGVVTRAVEVLANGGVVVLPTDTVYGLAARAGDPTATAQLFARKGREADVPVAVLCASAEQAFSLAAPVPESARRLADRHWPGALTLVLTRRPGLDWALGEPHDTIGIRCPDHDLVRALAAEVGPLATTSANRHGVPTPAGAIAAADSLLGPVDLVIDSGPLHGSASTVVDATTSTLRILRQGTLALEVD